MNTPMNQYSIGSYGYDLAFFAQHAIQTIELRDASSGASVLLVPELQGRVMTSSANGAEGKSYGWINYTWIESGKVSAQFNPYGGEERFWLGPEGGPFSIYFKKGNEQIYANWGVPVELDTVAFEVRAQTAQNVSFSKEFSLVNASGTRLDLGMERQVRLLSRQEAAETLQTPVDTSMQWVAYQSSNRLKNRGKNDWTPETGFLSVWMLSMMNPSESGIIFLPFTKGDEQTLGKTVTDDYFGKVPSNRLVVREDMLFFKADGKYRSKIGLSPERALSYCGSYDPDNQVLTVLWYSKPEQKIPYVNAKWGVQDHPLQGDVINAYNDGPVEDGSVMGPFYEIESSSPAALLHAGEEILHTQRIIHISGNEDQLSLMTQKLFGVSMDTIKEVFR